MLHELKSILSTASFAIARGASAVLVTVVELDGSSYRRPGVRMLVLDDGTMVGAVSGGCVEKEIVRQAQAVFKNEVPKMMVYDGRLRLGCDGILYLFLEPFNPEPRFYESFSKQLNNREPLTITTYYSKEEIGGQGGTIFAFSAEDKFSANSKWNHTTTGDSSLLSFSHQLKPCPRLWIVGAEHDAVELCKLATLSGWEVSIVAAPDEQKNISHFPGADSFLAISETELEGLTIDPETAIVLMAHSLVQDLKYLSALRHKTPGYLGLLGPFKRRERIISELLEYYPDTPDDYLHSIHGPCGLNLGAESPQEIAISILAEILSVARDKKPMHLKDKSSGIHQ